MILKKPKFWDFKKPNFFAYLLYPFTIFVEINNIILNIIPKKNSLKLKLYVLEIYILEVLEKLQLRYFYIIF